MSRLSGDAAKVYRALTRASRAVLPDTLAAKTSLSPAKVMAALSLLELEGLVSSIGGRYRAVAKREPAKRRRAKTQKRAPGKAKPVKSRRICRVLWFDAQGRFAKAPTGPAPHLRPRIVKHTTLKGVEGGGKAVITHANYRVLAVRYVPPKAVREQLTKARKRGDKAYLQAYEKWKREIEAELKRLAQLELDREQAKETAWALAQAYRSDKARKAAATRKKRQAKLSESDRLKAKAMAEGLDLRIRDARFRLARTKGKSVAEELRRKIARWERAKAKLERIASGRAYTWPKPSELR